MGNKQVKIALRLDDNKTFAAGSLLSGRVYLNVNQEQQSDGLCLSLVGEEYSQIAHEEQDYGSSGNRNYNTHREIDRASSSLVNMNVVLTTFPSSKIARGQYEFPFEWELPSHLPGSMYCGAKGDSSTHCEIRYRLDAYLQQQSGFFGQAPEHSCTQAVCIVAKPNSPPRAFTGIVMDPEVVRMKSCCFDSGRVALGYEVDKTVVAPNDVMQLGISGANESKVEISCLRARLIETVSWSAHGTSHERKEVLTEAQLSTANLPQWHSSMHQHVGHPYQHVDGYNQSVVETQLLLPSEARDTYSGSIVQVRHSLVVTAVTPPCYTTVESGSLIRVQRNSVAAAEATAPMEPTIYPNMVTPDEGQPTLVEAFLPDDWTPHEAQVVTLPSASAVLLDSDYVPPVASAPDESLLHESYQLPPTTAFSDLLDILAQSDDPVETVSNRLSNPAVATTIQNLTPREFVQVLQTANCNVPKLARLLAGAMGENFQCRHVLACVWSLPSHVRLDVLKEVAPLASDLDTQRGVIERELDEQELLYFKTALK